ncbi:unnamed protein product [Meloidogyne enterolobii]|uniref:Uncharacterized protein n=1 Tax=Meloidogyne enterolobii TaxID=390850 RepID=A0ACB0Z1Q6_MELEN
MQSTSSEDTKFPPILNSNLIKKQKTNLNSQVLITALGKSRKEERHLFHNCIEFVAIQDHILESVCRHENIKEDECQVCRFEKQLGLPHLPEMIFPFNKIGIYCDGNLVIEFNAFDALKEVNKEQLPDFKVGPSTVWQNARPETLSREFQKPFDWTYTSNYKGTLGKNIKIEKGNNVKINYEKLKRKDPIQFYSQIALYEDELADNGCAQFNEQKKQFFALNFYLKKIYFGDNKKIIIFLKMMIRIRIMPDTFFVLCRFYLRVDHVMVRILDTRLYGEKENNLYLIREWTKKEENYSKLNKEALNYILDPTELFNYLPLIESETTKIFYK